MKVEWKDFIKKAYVVKGDMFRLDKGEAPGLVAKARKIPVGDLLAANPGVEANRYIAGKWYHLPVLKTAPRTYPPAGPKISPPKATTRPEARPVVGPAPVTQPTNHADVPEEERDLLYKDVLAGNIVDPRRLKSLLFYDRRGKIYTTPRSARRTAYEYAARAKYGDKFNMSAIRALADADLDKAQRRRHADWAERGLNEEYIPGTNYSVIPHSTYVHRGIPNTAYKIRGVDTRIPVKYSGSRAFIQTSRPKWGDGYFTKIVVGKRPAGTDRYDDLHEGLHSSAMTSVHDGEGATSFWGATGDRSPNTGIQVAGAGRASQGQATRIGYSNGPAEQLVALGSIKAKMRVGGDDGSPGMGRRWAEQRLRERGKHGLNGRDWYLNEWNLEGILFDLYDKATKPGATTEDVKKYNDFLDSLYWGLERASNGHNNLVPRNRAVV